MENFHKLVWVKCPKCSEKGFVREVENRIIKLESLNWEMPYVVSNFSCQSCDHKLSNIDKKGAIKEAWHSKFKISIKDNNKCIACGVKNTLTIPEYFDLKNESKKINLKCNVCSETREYLIYFEQELWSKLGVDKYFGLDLFYQKNIKGNILWILNIEHLQFLKDYLLRKIRKTNTLYSSPENKLPSFIINRKNKVTILNYFNKIEKEIEFSLPPKN